MSPCSLPKDLGLSGICRQGFVGHCSLHFSVLLPSKALGFLGRQSSATHFCQGEQM